MKPVVALCLMVSPMVFAQTAPKVDERAIIRMANDIQKEVRRLPQYGVFDDIRFGIKGGNAVILTGYASRPVLKSGVENVVKGVEGVESVTNNIEVLPLSPMDDEIRFRTYIAVYSHPVLQRYNPNRGRVFPSLQMAAGGITNDPPLGFHPIHIIVRQGNVTLTGVADSAADAQIAFMQANSVPGVFNVQNQILIANESKPIKAK